MWKLKSINYGKLVFNLVLVMAFLTPLIFTPLTYEEYEFPKTFFLYFMGSLIIFLFLFKLISRPTKFYIPNRWILLFVSTYLLSTLFSSHLYTSVWGYYTRFYGGLVSILILLGIHLTVINTEIFRSEENKRKLILFISLSGIPISLYAIFQHFEGLERVSSTIGQPNWLALFLILLFPVYIFRAMSEKGKERYFWFFAVVLSYMGFWFAYSLSGLIGFCVTLIFFVYVNFALIKKNLRTFVLFLFLFLSISAIFPGIFYQRFNDLLIDTKNLISTSFRIYAQDEYQVSDPGFIRTGLWKGTVSLASSSFKNIIIGTGPETFPYRFPPFRPPELNYSSEWDFIFNKPHNYYLELWSNSGIISAGLFMGLLFTLIKTRHPFISPALLGFGISSIFGWPTAASALIFWLFISYLSLDSLLPVKELRVKKFSSAAKILSLNILFIGFVFFNFTIFKFFMADMFFVSSDLKLKANDYEESLKLINSAIKLNGNEAIYRRWRAKTSIAASVQATEKTKNLLKSSALEDLNRAYQINPTNLATLRNSVPLYYFLAVNDFSKPYNPENADWTYLSETIRYLKKVKEISSTDVGLFVLSANYENKLQLNTELETSLNNIRKLRPDLLEWHPSLVNIDEGLRNPTL